MENRNGLVVDTTTEQATGTAEREAALAMVEAHPGSHRITLGADKAYDTADFVAEMRALNVTPHVAQNHQPAVGDRRPHDAPSRLRGQPARAQAHRGSVRLDQDDRRFAQDPSSRPRWSAGCSP